MTNLVIRLRRGESVSLGPDVLVTVIEVRGASCRLSIDAPRNVDVVRSGAKSKEPRP